MKTRSIINSFILITFLVVSNWFAASGQQSTETNSSQSVKHSTPESDINPTTYNLTVYNPPLRYLLPKEVEETSGLAYFHGRLWTINDSGGLPVVYGLDTLTGEVVQRISIGNATNRDWESLAQDDEYLYIGDFGNNSGNRDDLIIYKVPLSGFPLTGDIEVPAVKISFTYEDYQGSVEKKKENNFDCEAFISVDDSLYLFSKNWGNQQTRLYRLPKTPGNFSAKLVATFESRGLITGADIDRTTGEIILTGYTNKSWMPFLWILSDYTDHQFFAGNKRRIDMLNMPATQVEAIVFTHPYKGVITSEGHILFSQSAYSISTQNWLETAPVSIAAISDQDLDFTLNPNPAKGKKVFLEFTSIAEGEYRIDLLDTKGNQLPQPEQYFDGKKDSYIRIKLKIKHLSKGTYFVRVTCGVQQVEKKLTIE
ncbi:MAG: T9SS type A sorting domain-containing protein [Bacteroidales bacterium]|nr:T9SS type A sorting domain-containing protein [Bacteroidales bacterium]